jgi:hypothetical protein
MLRQDNTRTLIRIGILALPVSGLLTLVGLIGRYDMPSPRLDPKAAAQAASTTGYVVSQLVGNVLGLTLLIFGVLALTVYLAETRVERVALAAMIVSIAGIAPIMSAMDVTTYALPVLGRAYLSGQHDAMQIVSTIFGNPLTSIFLVTFLLYAAGFILFGGAIWRSGEGGDSHELIWASYEACGERVRDERDLDGGGVRVAGCYLGRRNGSAAGRDDGLRWRLSGRYGGDCDGGGALERRPRRDAPR